MRRSKTLAAAKTLLVVSIAISVRPPRILCQTPSDQTANAFQGFFDQLSSVKGVGGMRGEIEFMKLVDSLGTMSPADILAGIKVIDRQLDDRGESNDHLARVNAALLLMFISWRPDGAELLISELDRLTSMLNDPSHVLSGPAATTLQHIGDSRSDLVIPILEAALKHPEVNNTSSVGPGVAVILLRMAPTNEQVVNGIAQYMRREDLTNPQLIKTIVGVDSSRVIPDALTAELVRALDRPDEHIKSRALVGIARSSPSAKAAALARIQKMANDPRETAHARRIAAEALTGKITENPDSDK